MKHLTAHSPNNSLIAVSTPTKPLLRIYDPTSTSLKFTLRIPKLTQDDDNNEPPELDKLLFATNQYLCASCGDSSIIVWDCDRGVHSNIINVNSFDGKKKRKSGEEGLLCDIATHSSKLYALVFYGEKGKCRVLQYDLNNGKLEKKIKVGSCKDADGSTASSLMSMTVSEDGKLMAVQLSRGLRICDDTGDKLCKFEGLEPSGEGNCVVQFSQDGSYLLSTFGSNVAVFKLDKNGTKCSLQPVAILKPKSGEGISSLDIVASSKTLGILTFQQDAGLSSYFIVPSDIKPSSSLDGMVPQLPLAIIQTKSAEALISSTFCSNRKNEILVLFSHSSNAAPGSGTSIPAESLSYDLDGQSPSGTVYVSPPLEEKGKKRKAEKIALASGETGMDASIAADLTSKKKRMDVVAQEEYGDVEMTAGKDHYDFKLEEEQDEEHKQSISDRLAMLSSAMEQTDEETDFDDEEEDATKSKKAKRPSKKSIKSLTATSESLTTLLTQALSSNDSIQLNIALQVTDYRIVENTVKALQLLDAQRTDASTEGYIPMLMGHIVRRMARRHTLVTALTSWIKAILLTSSQISSRRLVGGNTALGAEEEERMAREGRELALKLGPLRNFLNERVECFPQLLRLEGRLALLGRQL